MSGILLKNGFSGRRSVVTEKVFESICSALFDVFPRFARSVLRFRSLRREFIAVVHTLQISHALGRERSAPAGGSFEKPTLYTGVEVVPA